MRSYNEETFHGLPSNYPLKSPSPDMKSRSSIVKTLSPHNTNLKKSLNHLTPPQNRNKNQFYSDYATLPHFYQQFPQDTDAKIDKIFSSDKNNEQNERQYSSTHAKGHYVFEMPQEIQSHYNENKRDLMTTGKKMQYTQSQSHQNSTSKSQKNYDFMKVIQQKDMIISELKDMINLMTHNGKHLKVSQKVYQQQEYESMKNDVKILTIENQKLSEVIDKLKQKSQNLIKNQQNKNQQKNNIKSENQRNQFFSERLNHHQQNDLKQKLKQFQEQANHLKQILQQKQREHQNSLNQLEKLNQNLAIESRFFENQKERYSKQNQRLINLLRLKDKEKQTCYNNYSYFDKSQYQSSSQSHNFTSVKNPPQVNKNPNNQQTGGNAKVSIQKIKAQYEENLKLYKQNVYNEVYMMFDTINMTLEEINQKINGLEEKIVSMQAFRDSWKQRARSHLTSIEENDEQIKKSAIYIEDAPSSERMGSSSRKSRQALSVIVQESRRDNEKLQLEISQLKKQVDYYKQTLHQKLTIKGSESQQQIQQSYEKRIRELQSLLDQFREEKQLLESQLTDYKKQLANAQKENYQSAKFTELTEDQGLDQISQNQLNKMHQQVVLLTENLKQKTIKEHQLIQKIKQLENTQNQRQKQLLQEIQQFQILIKETQEEFKSTKYQYENKIDILNEEIELLNRQSIKIKMDHAILKKENQKLTQKVDNLEKTANKHLSNEKNMEKIRILVQSFNLNQKKQHQDLSSLIKSYIESLQNEISNRNHQKNELIQIIESQKDQILQLQQIKIELTQRSVGLQEKLKLYKLQFEKNKQFYSKFLQSNEFQSHDTKKSQFHGQKLNIRGIKTKAKLKIDELLNSQNKKISQLIDSIAFLSNKDPSEESSNQTF